MIDRGKCPFLKLGLIILLFSLFTGIAAATTVTILPDHINPDGMFTIAVQGLPNYTPIAIQIAGQFGTTPASPFTFSFTNMTWPVSVNASSSTVRQDNTDYNVITLREYHADGNVSEVTAEGASEEGTFTAVLPAIECGEPGETELDEYEVVFSGTSASGASTVMSSVMINLDTNGTSDFQIPVHVHGITTGVVQVSVLVNNVVVTSKELTVGVPYFDKATVQISSIPGDAAVTIDGVYVGQSPLYTEVVSGPRIFRLTKAGYSPWEKQVFVMYSPTSATYIFAEMTVQPAGSAAVAAAPAFNPLFTPVIPTGGALIDPNLVPIIPAPASVLTTGYTVNPNAILVRSIPVPFL